ncbi:hypothetical protein HG530_001498 [Fusarium avenaceum]|nr:hypothetical protein HG530_001498 [Fusarium avenaceum]
MGVGIVLFIYLDIRALKKDLNDPGCIFLGINCHMEHRETIGRLLLDVGPVIEEKADCVSIPIQHGITERRIAVHRFVDVIAVGQVLEIISS